MDDPNKSRVVGKIDWTAKFPEIAKEGAGLPDCIIDGEICAVDAEGVSEIQPNET